MPSKIKILTCKNACCFYNRMNRCRREEITLMPDGICLHCIYPNQLSDEQKKRIEPTLEP